MAKVRVYELARELNLDSKELVDRINAGGLNVKNYMSTLDEESVQRVKQILSGAVSEVIEEKRVRPTVIRRRKKTVVAESETAVEAEEAGREKPAEPSVEPVLDQGAQPLEMPVPSMEVGGGLPPRALPGEPGEAVDLASELAAAVEEKPAVHEAALPEEAPAAPPGEPPHPPVEGERAASEEGLKPRKGKKRFDRPARIIKSADEGPLRELLARRVEEKPEEVPAQPPAPVPEKETRPEAEKREPAPGIHKKKGGRRGPERSEIPPKGALRHRKKEIIEREDLYEGRLVARKDRRLGRKAREVAREQRQPEITVPRAIKRRIKIEDTVTVGEIARAMDVKAGEVIRKLMDMGAGSGINDRIDFESAALVADEFGFEVEQVLFEEEKLLAETEDRTEDIVPRPPVVTIMGHVDHGKTSLLDFIRKSKIIEGEAGGITQHIGAYYVQTPGGDIVFLDTPGHEAFTAMRARGAKVTDLIVLVVAADDGVMPQTTEAINHAKAAGTPIVVAINKIDKPEANPEKVKRELAQLGHVPEAWGGDTICGEISAKTGQGVDDLLNLILLQAEMLELKGNPNKPARGTIIEARLDKNKGPVATVLVKNGTLHPGDHFICGQHFGRVRAMHSQRGRKMPSAGPSVPVEIYGISGVPMAGDEFIVLQDEKTAKQIAEHRKEKMKKPEMMRRGIVSLDELFDRIKEGEVKEFNIVLKTDVQGSLEALGEALEKLSTSEVKLRIIHSGAGAITESDVMLASASKAIILGFNVRANARVAELADREKVDIRYYDVIYNAIKDIRLAMAGLLEPIYKEQVIGHADIKEVFHIPKVGAVAGCMVADGRIERSASVRLLRDGKVVHEGKIGSLRRFKEDVKEVQTGYECGVGVEGYQDLKPGDVFEFYRLEKVAAEL